MKALKIFGGLGLVLILLIGGLIFYVLTNLNQIVKDTVETVGPDVTETSVLLRDVDIKPFEGKGELNNFMIGNPQGFDSEHLIKWDTVRLQIDPASVRSDVIVIKDVTIEGVNVVAEQKGLATNLQKMLETLNKKSSAGATSSGDSGSGDAPDVRLMIENLRFADNSIDFVTEKYGSYSLDLPSFELANLGDRQTGLTPQELGLAILTPLVEQAKDAVEERIKGLAKDELEAKLEEQKQELQAKADEKEAELKGKLQEEEDKLENKLEEKLGDDAKDKLKGLFKRD